MSSDPYVHIAFGRRDGRHEVLYCDLHGDPQTPLEFRDGEFCALNVDGVAEMAASIERVRALHVEWGGVLFGVEFDGLCEECVNSTGDAVTWPCPTIQALEGTGDWSEEAQQ